MQKLYYCIINLTKFEDIIFKNCSKYMIFNLIEPKESKIKSIKIYLIYIHTYKPT
jgi:hypothetical protein